MPDAQTGRRVVLDGNPYRVSATKRGGMGTVWLLNAESGSSFDPVYRRALAVKTFDNAVDPASIEQELNVWISLQHAQIVPLKKVGRLDFRVAAVMPRLSGSLEDALERQGVLSETEIVGIGAQIAQALQYAWQSHSILHLDLKPSNVLLLSENPWSIQVADWGISRIASARNALRPVSRQIAGISTYHQTTYRAGTPLFMAPERFSERWALAPSADIYSLGLMLIQLVTGILPFRFGEINPLHEIAIGSYLDNASAILEGTSPSLRAFLLACIAPNPSHRIGTFGEILSELRMIAKRIA